MNKKPIIAVSGINAVDNPGPGVGVARSLKADHDLDPEIIGLAYDAMEPGIYMDWIVDRSYLMPYPSSGDDAYIDRLLAIKAESGLDLVIPNLDSELPVYIRHARRLAAAGIAVVLPTASQLRLRGKDHLVELAPRIGCEVPPTAVATSLAQVEPALRSIGFPAMVKGSLYEAWRSDSPAEAWAHINRITAEWGWPVLIQGIVGGDHLNVVGLGTGDGGHLGLVAIKKLNMTRLGKVWTGVTVNHPGMLAAAAAFVRETRWSGPFELECIVEAEHIRIIEVNPRFPAWCHMAAGVGLNLPSRLVRRRLGLAHDTDTAYPPGKLFIRYCADLVADMEPFQSLVTTGCSHPVVEGALL